MNWEQPNYQRISSAERRGDEISVLFEDESRANVLLERLVPPDMKAIDWTKLTYDAYELILSSSDNRTLEVPWSTIRTLTDREFSKQFARAAEEDARQIGLRIRELREARGITSKELAERAGITPQSLSRIENGRHDVVFTSLRRILAAMGSSLRDLSPQEKSVTSWSVLEKALGKSGITREFVLNRLVTKQDVDTTNEESLIDLAAQAISRVYGFSISSILEGRPLSYDTAALGQVRFKRYGRTNEIRATAYALYAHWLAIKVVEASPEITTAQLPTDPLDMRGQILSEYGDLNFAALLSYFWERGVAIIPLSDPGAFHGACWRIGDRTVIVLKQRAQYQGRWLYDLVHEGSHAAKHVTKSHPTVIETEEISPFSDDEEEIEASDFAEQLLFQGRSEELAELCVERAGGDLVMLKAAAVEVAKEQQVPVDWLANYLAFRLSQQGENWWGAASNLQLAEPLPIDTARQEFLKRVSLDRLESEDRQLLMKAISGK